MKHSGLIIVFALCAGCNEPQDTGGRNVNLLDNSDSRTAATMATANEASTNCQTDETCPMGYICRANATGQKRCVSATPATGQQARTGGGPSAGTSAVMNPEGQPVMNEGCGNGLCDPDENSVVCPADCRGAAGGMVVVGGASSGGGFDDGGGSPDPAGVVAGSSAGDGGTAESGGAISGGRESNPGGQGAFAGGGLAGMPTSAGTVVPGGVQSMAGGHSAFGGGEPPAMRAEGQCSDDAQCGAFDCNLAYPGGQCRCGLTCAVGYECVVGSCVAECASDDDCPQGTDCSPLTNRCLLRTCQLDEECGSPDLRCSANGQCSSR